MDAAALGFALGLGWWATPQIVVLAGPALAWLLWHRRRGVGDLWPALPAFAIGALPWFVTNVREDWASLHSTQARTSEVGHIHNLFTAVLPTALGIRVPFSLEWITGRIVGPLLFVLALAGFGWLLWRRPRGLGLLLLVCLFFPIVYTISPYTFLSAEPRYLTLLLPVLALVLAWSLRRQWLVAAGVAAALVLSVVGLARMDQHRLTLSLAQEATIPPDTGPVLRVLQRAGVKTAVADYWIAFVMDFQGRERIIVAPVPLTGQDRRPSWSELVRRDPRAARVFVAGAVAERRARRRLLGSGYRRLETGGFAVYVRPAAGAVGSGTDSG